ncbi:MAG: VCBS repeat-containing protein, partial [Actinobacteria bacterium]
TAWNTVWPYRIDYGAVVAADFNKDGKMDLAFSVHLQGIRVFLGDGKGHFTDSGKGLSSTDFPSRRLAAIDVDGDGYPDIVALSEGPAGPGAATTIYGKIRVFLNTKKGTEWKAIDAADPKYAVGGDYLAVGNFNGDKTPDFFGSSVYYQAHNLLFLSDKKKRLTWAPPPTNDEGKIVPFLSYYAATTAGPFSSKKLDDALVSYVRFWPTSLDPQIASRPPLETIVGIDRITFVGDVPQRVPLLRFKGTRPISGMASGDFDGDGKLDALFTRFEPQREGVILLGDGKGNFTRAKTKGLSLRALTNYDVTVADVNGDGRPDVIIMYESANETRSGLQDGSIQVFLNRGVEGAAVKSEKKK